MEIDPTLKRDSLPVLDTDYSHLRLMNDSRWPWFMVIPRDSSATELHHLKHDQRQAYLEDINKLSTCLQQHTGCRSVNIAMLGNAVPALHCHVVARDVDDANWPRPIWGFGDAVSYDALDAEKLIDAVRHQFIKTLSGQP